MPASPRSTGCPSPSPEEFRIEFADDVLPVPATRFSNVAPPEEDFEARLQETQEELLQLKHQARMVERRKEELEELNRKERDFGRGRVEMHDKLSRMLVRLEREAAETRRRMELVLEARQELTRHFHAVNGLHPEKWNPADIHENLDHGLAVLTMARLDYERTVAELDPASAESTARMPCATALATAPVFPRDFLYWLRAGLAFTLPARVVGLIALAAASAR
jgi:hypothetical protein